MIISKKAIIFYDSRGVQHFPVGSNFFQGRIGGRGGVQLLISIETYRTCDFPGGWGLDPLWIHACFACIFVICRFLF